MLLLQAAMRCALRGIRGSHVRHCAAVSTALSRKTWLQMPLGWLTTLAGLLAERRVPKIEAAVVCARCLGAAQMNLHPSFEAFLDFRCGGLMRAAKKNDAQCSGCARQKRLHHGDDLCCCKLPQTSSGRRACEYHPLLSLTTKKAPGLLKPSKGLSQSHCLGLRVGDPPYR